jgi:hypothetical protein
MFPFKKVPANPFYSYPAASAGAAGAAVDVQDVSRHGDHTLVDYKQPIAFDEKGKPLYQPIIDRGVKKCIISAHGGAKPNAFFRVPDGVRIIGYVEIGKPLSCPNALQTQICKNSPYISNPVSRIFNQGDEIPDYLFERDKKKAFRSGVLICNPSGDDGVLYNFDKSDDVSRLSRIVEALQEQLLGPFDLHLLTCLGGLTEGEVLSVLFENTSFFKGLGMKRSSKKGKKVNRNSKKSKKVKESKRVKKLKSKRK